MRWCHVAAFAVALLTVAPAAFARTRALDVTSEGCPQLDNNEVERILAIELGAVVETWTEPAPLGVELSCEGSVVRVVAVDPVTDKRVSREVDLTRVRDRDRTVALLASQLFLSSWAERLLVRRNPEIPPPKPAPPAIVRETDAMVRRAIEPRSVRPSILVMAGPRARALDAPIASLRVSARPTLLLADRSRVFLDLGYERGSSERASGSVSYVLAGAAAGVGHRLWQHGRLGIEAIAMAGVFHAELTGDPLAPTTMGRSASGVVGEGAIGLGPTLALGALRVGLELDLGITFPRAVGRVARDDDPRLSGLWTGASLAIAFEDRR